MIRIDFVAELVPTEKANRASPARRGEALLAFFRGRNFGQFQVY